MTSNDLVELSLTEAARGIRSRKISPVELTYAYLERIEKIDSRLNSYITVTADLAIDAARQAEAALVGSNDQDLGVLHGVPLALKDLFETAAVRTTAGSKFFAEYFPDFDAPVVSRLKAAGAVLLGKTNMHEIALGLTTVNPHYGACRNPWSLDRVPGGSSGGSAAALAARLCAGSVGSDTGGSIRVPAALCGVVGLKPTYGRVSLRGVIPLSWNLDHVGPMARRVQDAALLLQVIAGYDPEDPTSADIAVEDYLTGLSGGIRGLRVALAEGEYFKRTHPEVEAAVRRAADTFRALGAVVEPFEVPELYTAALTNGLMVTADAAAFHSERLRDHPGNFGLDVRTRLQAGAAFPQAEYVRAHRTQSELRRRFTRIFEAWDLVLLPTTPIPAPPIEGPDAVELARLLTRYTGPFNLTGLPALSVPCGFTTTGLPIGLQMVAAPWAEAHLLRCGFAYEEAAGLYNHSPGLV